MLLHLAMFNRINKHLFIFGVKYNDLTHDIFPTHSDCVTASKLPPKYHYVAYSEQSGNETVKITKKHEI